VDSATEICAHVARVVATNENAMTQRISDKHRPRRITLRHASAMQTRKRDTEARTANCVNGPRFPAGIFILISLAAPAAIVHRDQADCQ